MSFFDPAACGDGEEEVDDGGHGGEQADLQARCAEAGDVDVEEVYSCAAEDAEPGDVEVEVPEVVAVSFGDV